MAATAFAARAAPAGPYSTRSRCFFGSFANGASASMPNVRASVTTASRTSFRSPLTQGAIAPPSNDFDSSRTIRRGSKS